MRIVPAIKTYRHPKLIFLSTCIYCAAISYMAINSASVTGSSYLGALFIALCLCCALPVGAMVNCIFMTIPFTSVLKLPIEAFSFITLLQVIFIIKSLIANSSISPNTIVYITIVAFITQLFPFIISNQTFNNLLLLIFNLLTFYCAFSLTKTRKVNVMHAYFAFSVGVLAAGLIAQNFGIHVAEMQDYRFCGLWTDPNFWGMFCLIGIVTCLMIGFSKPYLFVITLPIIILLALQGFLTLSRTFIVVCSLMVTIITWSYLKRTFWGSLLIVCVLCVGIYYALPYAIDIFSKRELNDNDVTNGRFSNTSMIFDYMFNHTDLTLAGFGYNNVLNVMKANSFGHGATHNSYADLLVDFGIVWLSFFLSLLLRVRQQIMVIIKGLLTLPGVVFCIILFYMGTLSMLKYAMLFLFGGVFIGYTNNMFMRR